MEELRIAVALLKEAKTEEEREAAKQYLNKLCREQFICDWYKT